MSNAKGDSKKDTIEKHHEQIADGRPFKHDDTSVNAADVKKFQLTNTSRHSGSAGGDQDHSLEIHGFGAHASGKSKLTEKDLQAHPKKHTLLLKAGVQETVVTDHAYLEQIASLSPAEQTKIIGGGLTAFSKELSTQQTKIGAATAAGVKSELDEINQNGLKLAKNLTDIWQFSHDYQHNKPAAYKSAALAVDALSKSVVGGVRIIDIAAAYIKTVGKTGEYSKPFHDLAWLGDQIDTRWAALTPEKQAKITAKLTTEYLGDLASGFVFGKLLKGQKLTEALQDMGAAATSMNSKSREKAGQCISKLLDELLIEPAQAAEHAHKPGFSKEDFEEIAKPLHKVAHELTVETKDNSREKKKT